MYPIPKSSDFAEKEPAARRESFASRSTTQGVKRAQHSSQSSTTRRAFVTSVRRARPFPQAEKNLVGLLRGLVDEGLVDVGDDTTTGDGGLDEGVELLVTTDSELKVTGGDALHLSCSPGCSPGRSGERQRANRPNTSGSSVRMSAVKSVFENKRLLVTDSKRRTGTEGRLMGAEAFSESLERGRTLRSLEALPASSRTSAVRYSARAGKMARGMSRRSGEPRQTRVDAISRWGKKK